ncbi:hypothetical protein S1OALGB6SA_1526 [Olavius algarvensis spirochete endosymbiont]|nr:hypothetical protein S1OALGB6SA_1526 [Olavius algarvensis spirochete endosymbiont]
MSGVRGCDCYLPANIAIAAAGAIEICRNGRPPLFKRSSFDAVKRLNPAYPVINRNPPH